MKFLRISFAALVCFFLLTSSAKAADHYVAPNGTQTGDGTLATPWDLQTALNQPASVQPGDTIWLLGGTYKSSSLNGFASNLNGTATSPIIVRNYNGQRATIDGNGTIFTIAVYGSYTWFWGLEMMDSSTQRYEVDGGPVPRSAGPGVYGPGNKFINNVVHDTSQGFSAYNASPNSEFTGNIVYYNGFEASDRNHGHGIYMQNISGTKLIADNFVGDNAVDGMQIYGGGNATMIGFTIQGNSVYNNGSWPAPAYQYNIMLGGGYSSGNTVTMNYSYFPLSAASGFFQLGQYSAGQNLTATNNVLVGGYITFTSEGMSGPFTFTGNTLVNQAPALREVSLGLFSGTTTGGFVWDNNSYYGLNVFYKGTYDGSSTSNGGYANLSGWQSGTGLDAHSTYTSGTPASPLIYVRPNAYETKRANITVYNFSGASSVSVDLSSVLSPGDEYVIQDAQNFYGSPAASGVYGGGEIAIPMNGLTKATAIGFATPAHTAPYFGTFVVMVSGTTTAPSNPSGPSSGSGSPGSSSTSSGPSGSAFVSSTALGTLRNNYTGWVGMGITVGKAPIVVSSLGRMVAPGNTETHTLKIVIATSGADLPGSSTSLNTSGATAGSFIYGALPSAVILQPNTSYYILTQETFAGDQWYDLNTTVSANSEATITAPVYSLGSGYIFVGGMPGHSYGPVDFQTASTATQTFVSSLKPGTLRNNFTGWVGVSMTTGASALQVTQLGRMYLSGNTGTHTVKIVNASTGADLPGGSATVNFSSGQPGSLVYATLVAPVTLQANTNYYVVSQETAGGDWWYDWDTTATTTNEASDKASAWSYPGAAFVTVASSSNHMYVPVDFVYSTQ